jgi:hypothetical protein
MDVVVALIIAVIDLELAADRYYRRAALVTVSSWTSKPTSSVLAALARSMTQYFGEGVVPLGQLYRKRMRPTVSYSDSIFNGIRSVTIAYCVVIVRTVITLIHRLVYSLHITLFHQKSGMKKVKQHPQ